MLLHNGLNIAGNEASSFQTIDMLSGKRGAIVLMHGFTSSNKAVLLYCISIIIRCSNPWGRATALL